MNYISPVDCRDVSEVLETIQTSLGKCQNRTYHALTLLRFQNMARLIPKSWQKLLAKELINGVR